MRWNLRRTLALGAAVTLIGVGLPSAAYSERDPNLCKELYGPSAPDYMVCDNMTAPEDVLDVVNFWLKDDGKNLKDAEPNPPNVADCSEPGAVCPDDGEGDGTPRGDGDPAPDDYKEPEGKPECDTPGSICSIDGTPVDARKLAVGAADVQSAAQTAEGRAVTSAKDAGLRAWIDTELADDWKAGAEQFAAAVKRVGALAAQPGVQGIRFTSQLGYNQTFTDAGQITKFVTATSAALRIAAPGKRLAVHTLVPELGCGADETCKQAMAKKYPLLTPDKVESYLTTGAVDHLALDSGLMRGEYAPYKLDAKRALRNQWVQVRARAWDTYLHIAAEDASFAGAGSSKLTAQQTTGVIAERVSQAIMDGAAETVNLWSRWQDDQGQVYRIMGERHSGSASWDQLTKLDEIRSRLATLYNPGAPEVDPAADLKKLSEAFGQVFVTVG
ncbi:hypothetical protein C1I98_19000 [Spongiactinospora gelatinilytica]|uniref:Uncharacterized protein n=1 Tax=Spongiactinospora gelatinilytica TaxID=2666298 RepID=A0A2W2G4A7_9ACTN|nr:hypothetical protein [Spongiactinospora gelatinilytica]PZG43011.1 hypothetical protein C1I98_19000 [Spongiactinospora gelatinilytica]